MINDFSDLGEEADYWLVPKELPTKSPLRLLAIDKLLNGEEVLPKNFVVIFSPFWLHEEVRGIRKLYQQLLPVIGIQGRAVFLHSKYQKTPIDRYLQKQRKLF